jgi:hypothetical protein
MTQGASGIIVSPICVGCGFNQKALPIPKLSRFQCTLLLSFSPNTIFITLIAKFFSQCMTSKVCQIINSYQSSPTKKKKGNIGWKHTTGGPKMLSHCIVFEGCPCLNFNHGNIGAYFSNFFLHNMVNYNTKNSITIFFSNLYYEVPRIFVAKKYTSLCTKDVNILKKMIEMIFNFYEIFSIY